MEREKTKRPYRQVARARAAGETTAQILVAAGTLFTERYYDDVSMSDIAVRAGVTERTVHRKFGSKEVIVRELIRVAGKENEELRNRVPPGDVVAAVRMIVGYYESTGDGILRMLSLEERIPAVAEIVEAGRQIHRRWIERTLGSLLIEPTARPRRLAQLVVATDVYTWRLLRRDSGLSREETEKAVEELIRSIYLQEDIGRVR